MALEMLGYSTSNLSHKSMLSPSRIPVTYSLNTSSKWIYCNGQEFISKEAMGDKGITSTNPKGRYLNQVQVSAGTHQLFYSYYNYTGLANAYFGIQIFNPNSTAVTFTPSNYGHAESGSYTNVSVNSWSGFFAGANGLTSKSISANGSHWIDVKMPSSSAQPFSGNLRFNVDKPVIVTVYAYANKNLIDGNAEPYKIDARPKKDGGDGGAWSGYGNGYFYTSGAITVDAKDLASADKYFYIATKKSTEFPTISGVTKSDIILLNNVQTTTGIRNLTASPADNLGNWGAQYYYTFNFKNTTSSAKTINLYIRPSSAPVCDNFPVFCYSGNVTGGCVGYSSSSSTWKFAKITLNANQTTSLSETIQHIVGTNGTPGDDGHIIFFSLS